MNSRELIKISLKFKSKSPGSPNHTQAIISPNVLWFGLRILQVSVDSVYATKQNTHKHTCTYTHIAIIV